MTEWITSSFCSGGDCLEVAYQRSSFCGEGSCVEAATRDGAVLVRDSKNLDQPPTRYSHTAWATFLTGVKTGEFT